MQSLIEDEFLAWGFYYAPIRNSYPIVPAFEKNYSTAIGDFKVQVPIVDPTLLTLPKPKLLSIPDKLSGVRLPHLEGNQTICLFDQAIRNIDPLRPKALVAACIDQLERIIDGWVNGSNFDDIAAEFISYWHSERVCYRLSDAKKSSLYRFDRTLLNGSEVTEFIVAENMFQATSWAGKRGRQLSAEGLIQCCETISINVARPFFIPFNESWPLTSIGKVLGWLYKVDHRAVFSLLDQLRNKAKDSSSFMVLLSNATMMVGVRFTLTGLGKAAIGVNLPRKAKAKVNLQHTFSALSKRHCVTTFNRFRIENATDRHIFTRNNSSFQGLMGMKVCLIGAGTIGGYLAQSLVQHGAGSGSGKLYLYDNDVLKAGNLGRHILGIEYLGESKSTALKHFLLRNGLATNIEARDNFVEKSIDKNWDLVIDATGEQGFSLLLSQWYLTRERARSKTMLIHSWVSGFGHQAKALLNDGTGACYACLFSYENEIRTDRFPSFSPDNTPDFSGSFKRTCGESHLPFGSEASMTAVALAMRLLKQEGPKRLNYLQKSITDKPRTYPEKRIEPMRNCPVCQS
ncbi:ThiF family adenylyltransferase [Vibrio fluvialis]|nr:ThiF family adenylyltransferase [Vibrio fluvialis]